MFNNLISITKKETINRGIITIKFLNLISENLSDEFTNRYDKLIDQNKAWER